jgi:hypothetical protein
MTPNDIARTLRCHINTVYRRLSNGWGNDRASRWAFPRGDDRQASLEL